MPDAFGRSWPAGWRRRLKRAESNHFGSSMALKRKPSQKQKIFPAGTFFINKPIVAGALITREDGAAGRGQWQAH